MELTILCKVIDNFGDIGFVWRLCKNLKTVECRYKIRLIVEGLEAFKKIEPEIEAERPEQEFRGVSVFDATAAEYCYREFSENTPRVILECFQCGRPDWLERILFDENEKIPHLVQIINIEYLTAEDYADEFHCLKSGTRCARVRKVNFMPGFTAKTGGLILDEPFLSQARRLTLPKPELDMPQTRGLSLSKPTQDISQTRRLSLSKPAKNISQTRGLSLSKPTQDISQILFFSYRNNFIAIFRAMERFFAAAQNDSVCAQNDNIGCDKNDGARCDKNGENCDKMSQICINLAQGVGKKPFLDAYSEYRKVAIKEFAINELRYLSQEDWDEMMCACDILFVRGEDSLSRACLCGKPFVWQAYPQDENYQLVKVGALLERMRPHFSENEFNTVKKFWLLYNNYNNNNGGEDGSLEEACYDFLCASRTEIMKDGFRKFSASIFANGNFGEHLDSFIKSFLQTD